MSKEYSSNSSFNNITESSKPRTASISCSCSGHGSILRNDGNAFAVRVESDFNLYIPAIVKLDRLTTSVLNLVAPEGFPNLSVACSSSTSAPIIIPGSSLSPYVL